MSVRFRCLDISSLVLVISLPYKLWGTHLPTLMNTGAYVYLEGKNVYSSGSGCSGLDEAQCGIVSTMPELGTMKQPFVYMTSLIRNKTEEAEE